MSSPMQDGVFSVHEGTRYYRVSKGKRTLYDSRLILCLKYVAPRIEDHPLDPTTFCLPEEFIT